VELSDLIRLVDPHTGGRQAVRVQNLEDTLRARGQSRALRLARRLPATDGVLDAVAVDALLLRVHCELQRLVE